MARLDTSVAPYHDDFDEAKHEHRILFRPGFPPQVREMNQLQRILQNQIERFGHHVFEEGSMVLPGYVTYDLKYAYVRVEADPTATLKGVRLQSESDREYYWLDKVLVGQTTGVKAKVVMCSAPSDENEVTLYIRYMNSGTSGIYKGVQTTFLAGEKIEDDADSTTYSYVCANAATGYGSSATIREGVYFTHGHFVRVEDQTILLDEYSYTPSYRIGLLVTESILTPEEDSALYDNSAETTNYTAPGAHRYVITLTLAKRSLDTVGIDDEDFIELLRLESGAELKKVDRSTYAILEDNLARRTYDESGDYTVRPFMLDARHFYNDGTNNGLWTLDDMTYLTENQAKMVAMKKFAIADPGTYHYYGTKYRPLDTDAALIAAAQAKMGLVLSAGKAYVKGYEIETISNSYLEIDRALDYDYDYQITVPATAGNYTFITKMYGQPDINTYTDIELCDAAIVTDGAKAGTRIGYARARGITHDTGTLGTATATYMLYLFDIRMEPNRHFSETRSLFSNLSEGVDFTANISMNEYELSGLPSSVVCNTGAGPYTGTIVGSQTKWYSLYDQQLKAGDWIRIYYTNATTYKDFKVTDDPTDDNNLSVQCVDSVASISTPLSIKYLFAELFEPYNDCAVFPLPRTAIRKLRDENDRIDTIYTVKRQFPVQTVAADGTIALSLAESGYNEEFAAYNADEWIISSLYNGTQKLVASGDIVIVGADCVIYGLTPNDEIKVVALVRKKGWIAGKTAGSVEKSKSLTSTYVVSTASDKTAVSEISLGKCDIYEITSITMHTGWTGDPDASTHEYGVDITDRYDLDNGQRDNYYGVGKVTLKSTAAVPSGRVSVVFRYFQHGTNGNYFSCDSYSDDEFLTNPIPTYQSKGLGVNLDLRDCIDFRPTYDQAGSDFVGTGSSTTEMTTGDFLVDYSYYLNRVDKLYLDKDGYFGIAKGVSAYLPQVPEIPEASMPLYTLYIRANTQRPIDVVAEFHENKRYTMRDIGKLEKRIERMEYYTSLSMLEQATLNMQILDADGLDRSKNGIFVDSFVDQSKANVASGEFKCSIDSKAGECRPMFSEDMLDLVKLYADNTDAANYIQTTGDLVTLPYTETVMVSQTLASNACNVNPYSVLIFTGAVALDPPQDQWKDTETIPDQVVFQEGNYDAIKTMVDGQGTIWNDWSQTVGAPRVTDVDTNSRTYREIAPPGSPHYSRTGVQESGMRHGKPYFSKPGQKWPWRKVEETTTTTTTATDITTTRTGVRGSVSESWSNTNLGEKVVSVNYAPFIRNKVVSFSAKGMKPSTKIYPFFDDVSVLQHCTPTSPYTTDWTTDAYGKFVGTFNIPAGVFKTGTRKFTLTDSVNNSTDWNTKADAQYTASGLIETRQNTIISTRNAEVSYSPVSDTSVATITNSYSDVDTVPQEGWHDPLAQTFMVNSAGGAFLTSIDLYFKKKDTAVPVSIEIREMVAGLPVGRMLPFSKVFLEPDDVSVSATAATATTFTFESPVYVMDGTSYAFVVMSNSNNYELWVATFDIDPTTGIAYTDIVTGKQITENPYAGVFLKSQNAETWTPDQRIDAKFVINKAVFDTSVTGNLFLVNDAVPNRVLPADPFRTSASSPFVRVNHPKHGMTYSATRPCKVVFTGLTEDVNGIDKTHLMRASTSNLTLNGFTIVAADHDSYVIDISENVTSWATQAPTTKYDDTQTCSGTGSTITLSGSDAEHYWNNCYIRFSDGQVRKINHYASSVATLDTPVIGTYSAGTTCVLSNITSGYDGGAVVTATQNRQMNSVYPLIGNITLPDTEFRTAINVTSGKSVSGTEIPYSWDDSGYQSVVPNDTTYFTTAKVVCGPRNEKTDVIYVNSSHPAADHKSFYLRATISTKNANISPVIDLKRTQIITVANRIDYNAAVTAVYPVDYQELDGSASTGACSVGFDASASTIYTTDADTHKSMLMLKVGDWIQTYRVSPTTHNTNYKITGITRTSPNTTLTVTPAPVSDLTEGTTQVRFIKYHDETAPSLGIASAKYTSQKMVLAQASEGLKIKIGAYRPATAYVDVYYKTMPSGGTADFDSLQWVLATPDREVEASANPSALREYEYTVNGIALYTAVAIKVVMQGTNSCDVPRLQDLQVVSLL